MHLVMTVKWQLSVLNKLSKKEKNSVCSQGAVRKRMSWNCLKEIISKELH